jgi:hypothetical protein
VSVRLLDTPDRRLSSTPTASWWDPENECTFVVARPADERDLWADYLHGALHSYRKHGVETVLELDHIRSGDSTALFFAAVDTRGDVVAGVRAVGPLGDADDSHAATEWAGRPGLRSVRKMIDDRAPFGIAEIKSAWLSDERDRGRALAKALARSPFYAMAVLDVQFGMATAAAYVLDRWATSGGVVAKHIPATPYPTERYQTKMMWWDRRTFIDHAEPEQVSMILHETAILRRTMLDNTLAGSSGAWPMGANAPGVVTGALA